MSREQVVEAAERGWNMSRAVNVREGITRNDDAIPEQWFRSLKTADGQHHAIRDYYKSKMMTREDVIHLLDDYYEDRGWDTASGIPAEAKLSELGLDDVARDMEKYR
jgi:aldehyde:ferredoxin oxidoreductase